MKLPYIFFSDLLLLVTRTKFKIEAKRLGISLRPHVNSPPAGPLLLPLLLPLDTLK